MFFFCRHRFFFKEHKQEPTNSAEAHSTPKKLLFWENRHNETQKLEEELMTTRIREMETLTEVKELRLKVSFLDLLVVISLVQTYVFVYACLCRVVENQ